MRRAKLAEARKALGKSQEDVADELGVHRTQVSQWERGEATPHPKLRSDYANSINVTLSELHAFLSSLPTDENGMSLQLKITLAVEQAATEIYSHIANVVHGLLQTPDYAAAIARAVGTTATSEEYVKRNIEQRAHRQQRILNGAATLHVLQPEASLRWRMGDDQVMAGQMKHLVEVAQRPNVTIQVIPYDVGQYEALRIGTFSLNITPFDAAPTAELHAYGGIRLIDDTDEVAYFQDAFDHGCRQALSPKASLDFIQQLSNEWEQRT